MVTVVCTYDLSTHDDDLGFLLQEVAEKWISERVPLITPFRTMLYSATYQNWAETFRRLIRS